ncbi:MAG TPA: pyruvate dehydrogenase complex dihydrolipoamide acetyltransferase [Chthoniobacterales bacterium]|nr:pyruvate dehydrogenase complex dihydrolipoamide acetyltransferase [Chthoniobacterales bacterium]
MPEIQMPKLSDTMTEGTLVSWKKKKGDKVSAGDVIAEIETDKATMEWESPEDGTLTEIYVEEGGKVDVGVKIAFIGAEGEAAPAKQEPDGKKAEPESKEEKKPASEKKEQAETEKPAPAEKKEKETAPPQESAKKPAESAKAAPASESAANKKTESTGEARVKASPMARRVAAEKGIDLSTVKGTGPEGRVTESDVRAAGKSRGAAPAAAAPRIPAGEGSRISLTGMRKVIAERLVASKAPVPHFYLNIEIDAGPLMAARAELKSAGEGSDSARITVNDFVLKASVEAAVKVPKANASFDGDAIVEYNDVNLAIAVAIEDGLVTPVIRAAQGRSLREISEAVKDLAHRARNKRMKPEEFQGGSFTVSNLGSYGIDHFLAIINPPQGFILSIGGIVKKPVIDNCDQIVAGQRMAIGMSCDHRVIDGALGAEYLRALRQLLENPALLLV